MEDKQAKSKNFFLPCHLYILSLAKISSVIFFFFFCEEIPFESIDEPMIPQLLYGKNRISAPLHGNVELMLYVLD